MAKGVLIVGSMQEVEDFSCFKREKDEVLTGGSNDQLSCIRVGLRWGSTAKLAFLEAANPIACWKL